MSALIGALRVSLSADTANFEAGMKRAQRSTAAAATGIQKSANLVSGAIKGMVAGLSVGVIVNAGRAALEYAGHLGELADTLGLTTKDLQTFRYAAGQVGITQDDLENGIQKLTISMGKAQLGAKAQADAFKAIGISVDDLKGKNTGEVFRLIAERLQNVSDRSQRAAVEVALFGKAGAKLDNLLSGSQGRLNELSDAAEKLGLVLSDEQIQNADKTADRLEALQTVLKTQIAGIVADNADSILGLANALAELAHIIGRVSAQWANLQKQFNNAPGFLTLLANPVTAPIGIAGLAQSVKGSKGGPSVTVKLPPARPVKSGGGGVGQFLASGGSKQGREDHSAEDALRAGFQFDQELRRAQMDVLRATQNLATDYVDRTSIGIEILNAEKDAYEAELQYQQALFKLTKGKDGLSAAQAGQLKAANDQKDALERQALLDEEQAQRKEEFNRSTDLTFELERDKLQSEQQLATTAKEQRDIQLRLLDLSYRQERARLEAVLADEKASYAAKEEARRRLDNLNQTYGNDRKAVIQNTQGPMEQFFSSVPKNAAEAQEAMERLKVMGIDTAINGIIALSENFKDWRDIALQSIKAVLAELLRMQLMKMAFQLFGSAAGGFSAGGSAAASAGGGFASVGSAASAGGILHFASGGSMILGGRSGVDKNILALNGLPIARVSKGEAMHIVPDGRGMGGNVTMNFNMSGNPSRETIAQIQSAARRGIADTARRGM